jgi:hypothetical protein
LFFKFLLVPMKSGRASICLATSSLRDSIPIQRRKFTKNYFRRLANTRFLKQNYFRRELLSKIKSKKSKKRKARKGKSKKRTPKQEKDTHSPPRRNVGVPYCSPVLLRVSRTAPGVPYCSVRSKLGAKFFSRIRSYLSTCAKNGVSSAEALRLLFEGRWPAFMGTAPE